MISLEHLTKVYGDVPAVNDLSLEVPRGEIFGLLGPNGAGKTTTILMLVGLIQPTAGRCLVDGIDVAMEPLQVKQRIGYMPDDVGFYRNMTAEQNLDYFARLYRMPEHDRAASVERALSRVDLFGLGKTVSGYSKGMVQRLGIAKVLLHDPEVLILDEPTANLDPLCVADYREIVGGLADEGKTIVVSSHILPEVSKVCTSFAIMLRGRLIVTGSIHDLPHLLKQTANRLRIRIEARDPIPTLAHPAIESVESSEDGRRMTLSVTEDIRDELVDQCAARGVRLRELAVEEPSLEDIFMTYYHGL